MPHTNTAVARITAMIIQVEEFVKEASMPKRFRWSSRLISNCSIGLCIWLTSSPLQSHAASGQATVPVVTAKVLDCRILRVRSNGAPGIVDAGDEAHDEACHQRIRRPTQPAVEPIAEEPPDQKARDHIHQNAIGNACLALRH